MEQGIKMVFNRTEIIRQIPLKINQKTNPKKAKNNSGPIFLIYKTPLYLKNILLFLNLQEMISLWFKNKTPLKLISDVDNYNISASLKSKIIRFLLQNLVLQP
jgi:hypothetical protein